MGQVFELGYKSAYTGDQIDELLGKVGAGVVPMIGKGINLLDNAYFIGGGSQQGGGQMPINERGQTSYAAGTRQYAINRWIHVGGGTLSLEADGLAVSLASGSTSDDLVQTIAIPKSALEGRLLTASVYFADGTLIWGTAVLPTADVSMYSYVIITDTMQVISENQTNSNLITLYFRLFDPSKIIAVVRYELGTEQTLAHLDSNDNWVLNDPPPNYGLELLKCATSRADPSDTYANKSIVFQ